MFRSPRRSSSSWGYTSSVPGKTPVDLDPVLALGIPSPLPLPAHDAVGVAVHDLAGQVEILSESLRAEVQRRVAAESHNTRLVHQIATLTQQCEEAINNEHRRMHLNEYKAQTFWAQLVEETEAHYRVWFEQMQADLMRSMYNLWVTLPIPDHSVSLDLARRTEEVARQAVELVEKDQEISRLSSVLRRNEDVTTNTMTEFLKARKDEIRMKEQSMQERLNAEVESRIALEKKVESLESAMLEASTSADGLKDELSQAKRYQQQAMKIQRRLQSTEEALAETRRNHLATKTDLNRAQRAHAEAVTQGENELQETIARYEAEISKLRTGHRKHDVSLQELRDHIAELENIIRLKDKDKEMWKAQIRSTAMAMMSGFEVRLREEEEKCDLQRSVSELRSTIDMLQTEAEVLHEQLSEKSAEISALRTVIDHHNHKGTYTPFITATPPPIDPGDMSNLSLPTPRPVPMPMKMSQPSPPPPTPITMDGPRPGFDTDFV
eukprot:TRINITY_DN8968_c0_g1_i1.p1 TRINITY_DN8968_c0_g1~~TRINITY_DN8968_c0_g1_i1.p1  ORF type:complete len:494 (+),score=167.46 TRINITY_DN8968_c0_g1_i1:85-1566(+)